VPKPRKHKFSFHLLHVCGKYGIVSNEATAKRPRSWSLVVPRTASAVRRGHRCGALLYPVVPQECGARGPLRRPLRIQCTEPSFRWVPLRARQVCPLPRRNGAARGGGLLFGRHRLSTRVKAKVQRAEPGSIPGPSTMGALPIQCHLMVCCAPDRFFLPFRGV